MQKKINILLLFPLMLVFIMSATGVSISIEHSQHKKNSFSKINETDLSIQEQDTCKCLDLLKSHLVYYENHLIVIPKFSIEINREISDKESHFLMCLLEFYSSRAPPITA